MNYTDMDYTNIGIKAVIYYNAERKRVKAKIERTKAFEAHYCKGEIYIGDGETSPQPCYYNSRLPFNDWCEDCKYTQPFHMAYRNAAVQAGIAKSKLNRAIKKL